MKRLTILAGIDSFTGYGRTAVAFARGLEASGVRVRIRASSVNERFGAKIPGDIRERIVHGVQSDPWELLIHHPNFVPTPGKRTAYYSMNESTKLNPLSVHLLNKAEVVIVPSQFCAVTFSASGVTVPIRVVPLGVDPKIFHWREFPEGNTVVFGTAGSLAGGEGRKGLGDVVGAFQKAFVDDERVSLKIKCHPDREAEHWKDDKRIEVTAAHLSEKEMADWYASLTCFVSASKGEGFGLMMLESLATGRPVITHRFGGVSEFCDARDCLLLPHTLTHAAAPYAGHWALVKESDLIRQMQAAQKLRMHFRQEGQFTSARAVGCFRWKSAVSKLISVLNEFGALEDVPEEFHSL